MNFSGEILRLQPIETGNFCSKSFYVFISSCYLLSVVVECASEFLTIF